MHIKVLGPGCRNCQNLERNTHAALASLGLDASVEKVTDYAEIAGIWGNGETALPGDPPGELEVVDGIPEGGKIHDLTGAPSAFTPDYAPEEMFEIASKLYKKSR